MILWGLFGFLQQQANLFLGIADLDFALKIIHLEDKLSIIDRPVALPCITEHLESLQHIGQSISQNDNQLSQLLPFVLRKLFLLNILHIGIEVISILKQLGNGKFLLLSRRQFILQQIRGILYDESCQFELDIFRFVVDRFEECYGFFIDRGQLTEINLRDEILFQGIKVDLAQIGEKLINKHSVYVFWKSIHS